MIVPSDANSGVTYTQALSRGGALLEETRILLLAWQYLGGPPLVVSRISSVYLLRDSSCHRMRQLVICAILW